MDSSRDREVENQCSVVYFKYTELDFFHLHQGLQIVEKRAVSGSTIWNFDDLELPGVFPDFPGIFGIKIVYFKSWHWLNMGKQVLWENNLEIKNFQIFPFWNLVAKVIKHVFSGTFCAKIGSTIFEFRRFGSRRFGGLGVYQNISICYMHCADMGIKAL